MSETFRDAMAAHISGQAHLDTREQADRVLAMPEMGAIRHALSLGGEAYTEFMQAPEVGLRLMGVPESVITWAVGR